MLGFEALPPLATPLILGKVLKLSVKNAFNMYNMYVSNVFH